MKDTARSRSRGQESTAQLAFNAMLDARATVRLTKTQTRTRLEQLRDELPPEDQQHIVLRVDRDMAWNDLERALHDGEEPLDDTSLARESQRLRKRFQLIKARLRDAARREGLVS